MKKQLLKLILWALLFTYNLNSFAQEAPSSIVSGEYLGLFPKVSNVEQMLSRYNLTDTLANKALNSLSEFELIRKDKSNQTTFSTDTAVQSSVATSLNAPNGPILTFEGTSSDDNIAAFGNTFAPPSPSMAVGPNHVVQMVNNLYKIYDKTGNLVAGPKTIFRDARSPRVLYDQAADRWVYTALRGNNLLFVFITQTPDPNGAVHVYGIELTGDILLDYFAIGVWNNTYLATYLRFNTAGVFQGQEFFACNRSNMLVGFQFRGIRFYRAGEFGYLPVSAEGPKTPEISSLPTFIRFDSTENGATYALKIRTLTFDSVKPINSVLSPRINLPVAPFDPRNPDGLTDIEQNGSTNLDAGFGSMVSRIIYRRFDNYESMVMNHTVNVSGVEPTSAESYQAAIRWYELTRPSPASPWVVNQQSTYAPTGTGNGATGDNRWIACAGIDEKGNIALGYSRSSSTTNADIVYAERKKSDPLNTLSSEQVFHAATGAQLDTDSRWGVVASMTTDATDGLSMWFTSEYYNTNSSFNWRTRIGNFKINDPVVGPNVHFKTGGLITRQIESVTPATGSPNFTYKDYMVTVVVDQAPTQDVNLTFTNTGTAIEGQDFDLIITSPFVLNATNLSKDFTIRVYDNAENEPDEFVNIAYTLNVNGGDAVAAHYNQNFKLSIVPKTCFPGKVEGSITHCSATNSGTLNISGHIGSILRWESSVDNFATTTTISNTSTSLAFTNVTTTTKYRAVVQNGRCLSFSEPATVIIRILNTNRLYVNKNAMGLNDGTSWLNAFTDLQSASQFTCPTGLEIWVSKGTYKPADENGDRTLSYIIRDNIKVYGGFAGNEMLLTDRNYSLIHTTNSTILSGDLNGNDGANFANNTENSYSVVRMNTVTNNTQLDGFTITKGNGANLGIGNASGAGILIQNSSPVLRNCKIVDNYTAFRGSGIAIINSQPVIVNCIFLNNRAVDQAGAILNVSDAAPDKTLTITNSIFLNNSAVNSWGSIIYNLLLNPGTTLNVNFTNCSLSGNTSPIAAVYGLADVDRTINTNFKNCIFFNNGVSNTFGNFAGTSRTYNTIATYSMFNSGVTGYTGTNNIISDISPFVSATDLHLSCGSLAVDSGTDSGVPATDLDGNPRPFNSTAVDMGAYEYKGGILPPPVAATVSPDEICPGTIVTLTANCTSGIPEWHDQLAGGNFLGNGITLSKSLSTNTTYYVNCKNGACTSTRSETNQVSVILPSVSLNLTSDFNSNSTQIANTTIDATNKIFSPSKVIYRAGNAVTLKEGFEATSGSTFFAKIGGCENTIAGLVAYYPFNGNANDATGNGFNGTINGATLTADKYGTAQKALNFDGSNDFVRIPNLYNVVTQPLVDVTYSLWFKPNQNYGAADFYSLIIRTTDGGFTDMIGKPDLSSVENNKFQFYMFDNVANVGRISKATTINFTANVWYHVVATRANGIMKIYVNAAKEGETAYTNAQYFYPDLYLGGHSTFNRWYFNGALDDLRIYNRALSDAEVLSIYNAEKP